MIVPCIICGRDVKNRRDIYTHFDHCPQRNAVPSIDSLRWLTKSMMSYVDSNHFVNGIRSDAILAIISFCPATQNLIVIRCDGTVEACSRAGIREQVTQAEFDRLIKCYNRSCLSESRKKTEFLAVCTLLHQHTGWVLHQEHYDQCRLCRPTEHLPSPPFTRPVMARIHRPRGTNTGYT
jgi:hypothetical protein